MTAVPHREVVRLRKLSLVDDGDRVIVGAPETGVFIAVPPVGAVVIRALQDGVSVPEAAAAAQRFAGQPVDVATFVDRLARLGFLVCAGDAQHQPTRTAALQTRRWLAGPAPERVRWLFGRVAWTVYVTLLAFDIGVLIIRPQLLPHPRAAYQLLHVGAGPSLVLLFPLSTALVAAHECGHWLAARAAGLTARFGVDHRMYFVVFETDLSQLWSLPRRRRFGPLLAGLAVDSTALAVLLAIELGIAERWWTPPAIAAHLTAALAFAEVAGMAWQCLLFLRTDLYGVLVAATGCHNLWRVKTLSVRRVLKILNPGQAAELAAANPRDVAVAAWFRWLWVAGYVAAGAWFAWFYLPLLAHLVAWIGPGLATSPAGGRLWITIGCTVILAWRLGAPAAFSLRSAARTIRSRHRPDLRT
jgi:putative peptide zinc metalloprotease protein